MRTEEEIREYIKKERVFLDKGCDNLDSFYRGMTIGTLNALTWVLEGKEEF